MSQLLEMLMGSLGGNTQDQISNELGVDREKTSQATGLALTTLLGALQRNTASPDGAEALNRAIEKDHDGSILDNLDHFLGKASDGPGDGILKHVLGNRRSQVQSNISQSTGLDSDKVSHLMTMLAPVVLGALGKQQRRTGMNASTLAGYLGEEAQSIERTQPGSSSFIGKLLDSDGDGDVDAGDMLKHGSSLLGKLFKR